MHLSTLDPKIDAALTKEQAEKRAVFALPTHVFETLKDKVGAHLSQLDDIPQKPSFLRYEFESSGSEAHTTVDTALWKHPYRDRCLSGRVFILTVWFTSPKDATVCNIGVPVFTVSMPKDQRCCYVVATAPAGLMPNPIPKTVSMDEVIECALAETTNTPVTLSYPPSVIDLLKKQIERTLAGFYSVPGEDAFIVYDITQPKNKQAIKESPVEVVATTWSYNEISGFCGNQFNLTVTQALKGQSAPRTIMVTVFTLDVMPNRALANNQYRFVVNLHHAKVGVQQTLPLDPSKLALISAKAFYGTELPPTEGDIAELFQISVTPNPPPLNIDQNVAWHINTHLDDLQDQLDKLRAYINQVAKP